MEHLFTKTSKILRDNWIIELQNTNDFLKNKLSNINLNPFFGFKVIINEHARAMGSEYIPRTEGILYNITKGTAWVLYKNENNKKKISCFYLNNLELVDPRFDKFFE